MADFIYTREQRKAIMAALPDSADAEAAISALEKAASDFQMHDRERSRARAAAIHSKYSALRSALASVGEALKELPAGDPFWPSFDRDATIEHLEAMDERAKELAEIGAEIGAAHAGKRKPFREILCDEALNAWIRAGGRLAFSRPNGTAGGPTIRFLQAALGPVLGDRAPMPETLAKAVTNKRERIDKAIADERKRNADA